MTPVTAANSSLFIKKDLKANESRLKEINNVASELEAEGLMAEEPQLLQAQVRRCGYGGGEKA